MLRTGVSTLACLEPEGEAHTCAVRPPAPPTWPFSFHTSETGRDRRRRSSQRWKETIIIIFYFTISVGFILLFFAVRSDDLDGDLVRTTSIWDPFSDRDPFSRGRPRADRHTGAAHGRLLLHAALLARLGSSRRTAGIAKGGVCSVKIRRKL